MANTNSFNIDELKHALINSIGMLQNMYKYTSISAYNFNTIIDKSIADVNKLYSKTTKESIDELFEKRVSVYMSMFIRKSLLYGNSVIVTFIDMYTLDKNNIQEAKKMLNEIENIYINSYFIPSYNNINSLINTSFKLDSILNILYKNNIFDEYMESSNITKTFIEVYCDRNNINLIELLTNTTINNSNNITEEIDSNTICILTKLFNLEDNLLIKNIIKDNPNIKCGLLINNVRQSILKGKNRSYNFLKFVNTYNKRIEYAIEDDYIIELAKLKKGIYKYLSDYSSEQIDNVIKELPSSYLIILHNSYGKSLRYYNFNKNLGLQSQKKLSVVLCTIKDYLRYINNEYKEEKVESSFYNKLC